MVFFDTNIFIYAVSAAEEDQEKRRIARSLLADEEFALSIQVVQEFIKPSNLPLPAVVRLSGARARPFGNMFSQPLGCPSA